MYVYLYSGPTYRKLKIKGNQAIVTFNHADGLASKRGELFGFELAGADRQFKPAKAIIQGNTVSLESEDITKPVAVRYAWADDPGAANLVNGSGLPAPPFRTDSWPGIVLPQIKNTNRRLKEEKGSIQQGRGITSPFLESLF